MQLPEEKPIQLLKFIFTAHLRASFNNYASLLPSMDNVNSPRELVPPYVNSQLVKWCQWKALNSWWGTDIAATLTIQLFGPCSRMLPIMDTCGGHNPSKLCHSCCLASLSNCCHHSPIPITLWPIIDAFLKNHQKTDIYLPG